MSGVHALARPDGRLVFREGVWERMRQDADPPHGAPAALAIQHAA